MTAEDKRLAFGPKVAISFANREDYARYGIAFPGHLEWGYGWIRERLSMVGPVGVLQHSDERFFFDTYLPLQQIHFFYNLLEIPGNFFSPFHYRLKRERLSEAWEDNYYHDICCPLQLHVLSELELERFIEKSVKALKVGGNLILAFNLWIGCDAVSEEILRTSETLRRYNKQVNFISGVDYRTILQLSEKLELIDDTNSDFVVKSRRHMETAFKGDNRLVFQHSRSVFQKNFPKESSAHLAVSDSVMSMAACLWFKKLIG